MAKNAANDARANPSIDIRSPAFLSVRPSPSAAQPQPPRRRKDGKRPDQAAPEAAPAALVRIELINLRP
jgi:hypothetical protein